MKIQKLNANNLNPMEMNNASAMMGAMNLIQKIGKGKRKYEVNLDKNDKKFLGKFIEEAKKQFVNNGDQVKAIAEFFDYMKSICDSKEKNILKLSFEELEFLKKMLSESVRGMKTMKFKWWEFIKKSMVKVMLKQYEDLLKKIN